MTVAVIEPDEDEPSERYRCEKRSGHRDYHGTLSGLSWMQAGGAGDDPARVLAEVDPIGSRTARPKNALRRERAHFKEMAALATTDDERDLWLSIAGQVEDYLDRGRQASDVPLLGLLDPSPP